MRYIISFALASLLASTATAEVPRVVTDIPPVGSLVAQVMGDLGTPLVLLDKGADAHAFQMRPSQAGELAQAGLVVWIGPEMTPWLERAMDGLGADAADLRLLADPATKTQPYAEPDAREAAGDHDDGHNHEHGEIDPHAWLNPGNAAVWLGIIAARLSDLDPGNAATYTANAARAQADLTALDAEIAALLTPAQSTPLVVFHNAYGYFASHYGLTVAGAIRDGDAAAPGAAHLQALQDSLAATPACLFPEANHDPKLVTAMAEGTGAQIGAALDPAGAALMNGPGLYGELLRALAVTIAECAAR